MESISEENDPIIQEIPVYLSQALSKNLYIYQYPVRPANRDWTDVKIVNASIKPKNQLVRLELGLDTYSKKYNTSKGEEIAINTDGTQDRYIRDKDKEQSIYFRNGIMDKIVYESNRPCMVSQHYGVAILQDKELHVTPIQGIVQLKPCYSYFDKQEKRKNDKNKAELSDEEVPEAQQVTVKFARQETEVAKKAREKSYETISQKIAVEPWYDALWKSANTDYSELERLKLISSGGEGAALAVGSKQYLHSLMPADLADNQQTPQQQISQLLVNAKIMRFSELRSMVRSPDGVIPEQTFLTLLSACACCVRGLWTARSSDVFGNTCGIPASALAAARDHVLYLFTQHPYIDRRKVAAAVRLPPIEVLSIIRSVAKFNPRVGWELILPPDTAFEAKYPDVVHRQNLYWEAKQRLFNEMHIGESVPKRQRKKSQRDSVSSDTMLSPKPRCNSVSEEDSERKRQKNKSATGTGKRTRNVSLSSVQDNQL